jgi:hypothetical protein
MMRIALSSLERRVLPQQHPHQRLARARLLSSEHDTEAKKVLTDKEQQENTRWAIGFFCVIMFANFFTIWQEWDALTGKKNDEGLVSNGVETIDLYSNDTKPRTAKYSY